MTLTDWYEPDQKPVRAGWYDAAVYDCGWIYEWRIRWDGLLWRDVEGNALADQAQRWRGLSEENKEAA